MDTPPDQLPTAALLRLALDERDEDHAWTAVVALHHRGSSEVLAAARQLCQPTQSAHARRVGADILGQLGVPERSFPDECLEILLEAWAREPEEVVLHAIAVALGHLKDPRAIAPLARGATHQSARVRYGVVIGLLTHTEDLAVRTLIQLSQDSDEAVRDWATFGLGTQIDLDTPALRDALAARLTDVDPTTRIEACKGLLKRQDERLVAALQRELSAPSDDTTLVEALILAAEVADPSLYPAVRALPEREPLAPWIADALAACRAPG